MEGKNNLENQVIQAPLSVRVLYSAKLTLQCMAQVQQEFLVSSEGQTAQIWPCSM